MFTKIFFSSLIVFSLPAFALQIQSIEKAFPGRIEIIVQPNISELDVLFVVDDSGSMTEHQINLIKNIPALTEAVVKSGVSIQAGVTTTSMDCGFSSACGGKFSGTVKVAKSSDPSFVNDLQNNLNVGNQGSGEEKPFDATISALSDSVSQTDHPDFLRAKAHLAVIYLTDADDQSKLHQPDDLVNFLKALKTDPQMVNLTSIQMVPQISNCTPYTTEQQGPRISSAVSLLKGQLIDICDPDFGKKLGNLGSGISNSIVREIPLTAIPDFKSIQVTYGSTTLAAGDLNYGWVYDSVRNVVILGDKINWSSMTGKELVVSFIPKDWQ